MTRKRDHAQTKEMERDADKKSHPAPVDDDIIQQH
jgi:hypothetical protein